MKTIIRLFSVTLLAVMMAVAAYGQDAAPAPAGPCTDTEGANKLYDQFTTEFDKRDKQKGATVEQKRSYVNIGKQYLEKYGSCEGEAFKEQLAYFKKVIPKWDDEVKKADERKQLITTFNNGMKSKNWDDVYASGKKILQLYPDDFRDVELVLGSIGLDETAKKPRVTKWNDDTIRFATQAIADLDSGKTFKDFGINEFKYGSKENALGWMYYTLGYIYYFDKQKKSEGLSYLYKATQANSDTKSNPIPFQILGFHYLDEAKKLAGEADAIQKSQSPSDTEEVSKQKKDAYYAKVGLLNGNAVAGIDAFARAHKLAKAKPTEFKKEFTDGLMESMKALYEQRFGKIDGFDAFVAEIDKKPLPNPTVPVAPINDAEAAQPATGAAAVPAPATPAAPVKSGDATTKPPVTAPAKPPAMPPAVKTGDVSRPQGT